MTGLSYHCMSNVSCRSSNVVYALQCKKCGMQYVGQTMLRIKDRFVHHFYDISVGNHQKSVGHHFVGQGHSGITDAEIFVLEFVKKPPRSEAGSIIQDRVERRWIHLLRTMAPLGLNTED